MIQQQVSLQLKYMYYYHLLIEGALFSVCNSQMRTSRREERKESCWRQCRNFRQSVSADNVHDGDISARVDDDSRKVEQAIFDRSAKDERSDVLAVRTEGDVVSGLVVCCSQTAAHCNHGLFDEVVQTDDIAAIWSWVVTKCHATRPIARVECHKQADCRIIKQRL